MIGIYKYYSYILYISGIRWWFHTLSYNFESFFVWWNPKIAAVIFQDGKAARHVRCPRSWCLLERFPTKKTLRSRNCRRSRRSTLSDSDLGEALPKDEEVFGGLDFFSVWLDTIWGFENVWKSGAGFNSSSHPDHDGAVDLYRAVDFLRPANDDFLTQLITAKPVVGPPVFDGQLVWTRSRSKTCLMKLLNLWPFFIFTHVSCWSYLVISDHIWSYLIISGHIWSYLVISGHIWSYLVMLVLHDVAPSHIAKLPLLGIPGWGSCRFQRSIGDVQYMITNNSIWIAYE